MFKKKMDNIPITNLYRKAQKNQIDRNKEKSEQFGCDINCFLINLTMKMHSTSSLMIQTQIQRQVTQSLGD